MIIEFLAANPLLLLFGTAAIGYAIGRIKIKGASLGVAAVLFVGLIIGSFSPELRVPDFAFVFGLAIFVYTIGLSSGAGFFASFKGKGLRDNLFILALLLVGFAIVYFAAISLPLKSTIASGIFAGSLTNTPALAAVIQVIKNTADPAALDTLVNEPVVGYSVTYPVGVLGPILAIFVMSRIFRIDYKKEAGKLKSLNLVDQDLYSVTARVTNPDVVGVPLSVLRPREHWSVVIGRVNHDGDLTLADGSTQLGAGDLVAVIGPPAEVEAAVSVLGEPVEDSLDFNRGLYDNRRIFVSHPEISGRKISDLDLPAKYGAIVTRVRRGDVDILADADTVLELGDRVRVVAKRDQMRAVSKFFGDSYRELSEIDLLSFGLGMSLGLLLGAVPIPIPGGEPITLGSAGGPLVMALILGALRRTGPIVWTIPYSANLTLRQLGLVMLLATVGLKSGYTFVSTFAQSGGLQILGVGATVSIVLPLLALLFGYLVLKIPYGYLAGMVASMGTQPATLGFSSEQAKDDSANVGYATVYPVAMISKIILAQLLLRFLGGV